MRKSFTLITTALTLNISGVFAADLPTNETTPAAPAGTFATDLNTNGPAHAAPAGATAFSALDKAKAALQKLEDDFAAYQQLKRGQEATQAAEKALSAKERTLKHKKNVAINALQTRALDTLRKTPWFGYVSAIPGVNDILNQGFDSVKAELAAIYDEIAKNPFTDVRGNVSFHKIVSRADDAFTQIFNLFQRTLVGQLAATTINAGKLSIINAFRLEFQTMLREAFGNAAADRYEVELATIELESAQTLEAADMLNVQLRQLAHGNATGQVPFDPTVWNHVGSAIDDMLAEIDETDAMAEKALAAIAAARAAAPRNQ